MNTSSNNVVDVLRTVGRDHLLRCRDSAEWHREARTECVRPGSGDAAWFDEHLAFAVLGDSDDNRRKLYELNKVCSRDIPNRGEFYTLNDYVAQRINVPSFLPEGVFIAVDGEEWIGMCALSNHLEQGFLFVEMTGVRAAYRRRGISLALKVLALRFARTAGAVSIRTFHHRENLPAIRANVKLGFRPYS